VPKPPGQFRPELALLAVQDLGTTVLDGHTGRYQPLFPVRLELGFALGCPPESHELFTQLDAPL